MTARNRTKRCKSSSPAAERRRAPEAAAPRRGPTAPFGRVALVALVAVAAGLTVSWGELRAGGDRFTSPTPIGFNDGSEYHLGPLDKVRVKVYEWRPARDEILGWAALNADYTVGPTGMIALPLVGEIRAGGVGTARLAHEISRRLQDRMGLATPPDTVIEVVEFRPIYVVGQVEKPGEYAFRPGLTALQALSLSGGLMRSPFGLMRLDRDILTHTGDLSMLERERQALVVRRARLKAELDKTQDFVLPPEVVQATRDTAGQAILEQESLVFTSRRTSFATQMSALRELRDYLTSESKSLAQQMDTHKRQRSLLDTELNQTLILYKKGLVTVNRKLALERNVAQLEGDGLRLESALLRARQEVSRTEIAMIELENKRADELTSEMVRIQTRLDQLDERLATSQGLLAEARTLGPLDASFSRSADAPKSQFTVVRVSGGRSVELTASEATEILPGDTIKVAMPPQGSILRQPVPEMSRGAVPPLPRVAQPARAELDLGGSSATSRRH